MQKGNRTVEVSIHTCRGKEGHQRVDALLHGDLLGNLGAPAHRGQAGGVVGEGGGGEGSVWHEMGLL